MANGCCDSNCDNCVYSGTVSGGAYRCCNYYIATDQRRPCPAGVGCTVKVGREVKRKKSRLRKRERKNNGRQKAAD